MEKNGDSVIDSFGVILNQAGEYEYAETNETRKLRFIADVYGEAYVDDLEEDERDQSAAELIHYLCEKRYGINDDKDDPDYDPAYILKMINMRYAMSLNGYQQYRSTTLASDVSAETAAAVMENQESLDGVDVEEISLRCLSGRVNISHRSSDIQVRCPRMNTMPLMRMKKRNTPVPILSGSGGSNRYATVRFRVKRVKRYIMWITGEE